MDHSDDPIRPDELDGLFTPLVDVARTRCALAVSGGGDSTALMVLFADWLHRRGQDAAGHTVLTVDHGLRAGSAAEARSVAVAAADLGYRHATLAWPGTKPRTGIQEAARKARYRLLGDYMRAHGIPLLLTGHTRDDQAETLIMRLARGSGVDGLSAMAPLGDRSAGETAANGRYLIARPLLDVPKARLRATLRTRGIPWMEDPSNAAPEFERPRLRAARAQLDALGLTDAMLALSAARLLRARRALDRIAEQFCDPSAGAVAADPCGIIAIDRTRLRQDGEEIALRVLQTAIVAAGGSCDPVPLGRLEAIAAAIRGGAPGKWTLARALIAAKEATVTIEREPGREQPPELTVAPGASVRWDGRFRVRVAAGFSGPVQVRALGAAALRELRRCGAVAAGVPARAGAMVPSMWHGAELVAVPSLGYWKAPHGCGAINASFIGIATFRRVPR